MDFSIEILATCARTQVVSTYAPTRKHLLTRRNCFNPQGFTQIKITTVQMGGYGTAVWRIPDPGSRTLYPAMKQDAVNISYGLLPRLFQGVVSDDSPRRIKDSNELEYTAIGHAANYARNSINSSSSTTYHIHDIFRGCVLGTVGGLTGWIGRNFPWVNPSETYIDVSDVHTATRSYLPRKTPEEIINDALTFLDYEWGMHNGPDSFNQLGCYVYFRPRLQNRVDWIIQREDLDPDSVDIDYDCTYFNNVNYRWIDSGGTEHVDYVADAASQARYTPGAHREIYLDLSRGNGYLDATNAALIASAWLTIGTTRKARGKITVPYGMIMRTGSGRKPAVMIKAGDNVRLPHLGLYKLDTSSASATIDNTCTFHVYGTTIDDDAAQNVLEIGEVPKEFDAMLAQTIVEKAA